MFIQLSHDEIGFPKLYGLNKSFHKNQLLYDIDGTDEMTEANLKKWETRKRCKNLPPLPPSFLALFNYNYYEFLASGDKKVINVQLSTRATIWERKLEVCSVLGEEDQHCPFIFYEIPHQWQLATC